MRRKFLLKVMILSLLFVAMGGGDLFAQSVTTVTSEDELATALAAGGKVELGKDIVVTNTIEILSGTKVTLDLNGKTISSGKIYPINNNGDLTINDSDGNGVIKGLGIRNGYPANTKANYGAKLTINGGSYENIYPDEGAALHNEGRAYINAGIFHGQNYAIYNAANLEINGSSDNYIIIEGYNAAIVYATFVEISNAEVRGPLKKENGGDYEANNVTFYQARIGEPANYTSYKTLAEALTAAQEDDEVYVFAGTYDVPSVKAGITINGEVDENGKTKVLLNGTLSGTLENLTLKNLHIKGGNAQRWAYAKGNLNFENVTFEATSVYAIHFDGIDEGTNLLYKDCTIIGWAAMGGSPESCKFEGCTIKDNGTYGVIRTYFNATIEGCTFDIRNANPNDVYQDGIHAVDANVVVSECTNIIGDNGETGDMKDIVNVSGSSIVNVDDVLIQNPAKVGDTYYATIQDAIVAAAPNGTVELRADVTVDKWIMFSERLSIGNGNIITTDINGLTIDGNDYTLTIESIESAGNGNRLFYDATKLNIQDLTIECVDAAASQGGIGLTSGTISNVNFIGGGPAIIPGTGEITVTGCTFKTNGTSIYYEEARDNLVVNGNTFENPDGVNVILLRGNTEFTNNIINSGRTVNVVSGSPVVSGNNFNDVRFKVYNAAEATISNNTINNLEFNDESVVYSTFTENTLSDDAQAVLDAASFMIKVSTKVELNAAINAAKDGDVIEMTADIDYGTDQLKIEKPITLDLGGKTLTTRNAYGGMSIKNNPTIKNGNIVHASNTAAIKVWNATAFEDLVIDVQGKGDANKTIGGIVLQSGTTTRVGSIKNVTIEGDALTNGIETYNCGDATENVIGSMENVNIDAVGTAMLISAPCGTATNCIFDGGVNGIEIWIKGNYSASLGLVDCDVVGGVFAHDEFNSNPEIVNNGTLNLTADEATTGAGVDDVTLTLARVEAENVDGVLEDVMEQAKAKVNNTYYQTLAEAVAAAQDKDVIEIIKEGNYTLPEFAGKELTFKGTYKVGTSITDWVNKASQGMMGSTVHFESLTISGQTDNYYGLFHTNAVTYKDCNINGLRFLYSPTTFTNCAFNADGVEHSFWTYGASNVTVTGCTFTYKDRAVNCYSEAGANHELDIIFTDCTFTYKGSADAPEGAVEINSGSVKSIDLVMNGCTAPEKGAMWFNSQWDSKKGENTVVVVDGEIVWQVLPVAKIGDVEYKSLQAALDAAAAGTGNVTVEILRDIDLTGIDWNPVTVSAPGYPVVTVKGNSKTITGLNDMLFAGTWAGGSGLIINDLTIADSDIVNDKDDAKGTVGVGAFIGFPQASATITLNNCHLVNSTVEGGHWTGGLIGYSAGYAGNDGPVFMNLTITNCSVTGSTITGKGSVGGIIGHGSGNGWTDVVIEGTTVSGNTITSTGTSTIKAGAIMGTIGAAGQPTTANGVTLTGGAMVAATVSGNTVTSGGTAITTIYGRQGTETGILELNGGTYDNYPIERGVAYAKPAEGFLIKENTDGTFGVTTLDGEGTEDNPYIIKDLAELIAFRDDVNGGNNYAGKHVKLDTNIDLSSIENWTPIGDITYNSQYKPADASKVFSGVFDGNNMVISNLTISRTVGGADTQANVGLFGITGEGADIKDLILTNVNITTDGRNVGALAGFAYKATLDNITVNGNINIKGGNNVSGVAGMTRYHAMSATNINVIGDGGSAIVGNNIVGGIFAEIAPNGSAQTFNNLSIENVAITGASGVGGIVGLLTTGAVGNVTVKNVVLTGRTDYQGDDMGRIRLGSVAGLMGGEYATIANVTTENVTAKNIDGDAVVLPIIGANYDASSNATEAKIGDTYYATLRIAFAAVQADETITLLADANISGANISETLKVNNNITLDLNGYTITGTDNATNSFALIEIQPGKELVVNDATGNGKITLTATNDRDWNAYSSVISNQRGKLTVNGGTIEHLGGTDMAYAIDNLTNTGNQIAATIVNGGIIKSTYRAIRQFLNSSAEGVNNILTINGGTIEGANKSIWMQDSNANANPGTLTVGENAQLKGDVYLSVTEGSTSWPVEVSIAAAALQGESTVMTNGNVPAGYELKVTNDVWGVEYGVAKIGDVLYATLQEAVNVGGEVKVIANITLDQIVTVAADKTVVLDLNGKKISISDEATNYAINNLGTLTLKDSSEGKTGAVNARGIYNGYDENGNHVATAKIIVESGTYNAKGTNGGAAIYNYGIAEINGGTFTSIGGYSLNNQSGSSMTVADGVTANNGIYVSGATLTINGGDIDGNRSGCHVVYAWNSTVTINGGDFYNNNSGNATIMAAGTTQMTIKGGIFGIKDGRVQGNANTWTSCLTDTQNTATMIVIGGTFNGGFRVQNGTTMTIEGGSFNDCCGSGYNIWGTATVKGGTFTDNAAKTFAEKYLADGFKLEENEDGTSSVVPFVENSYVIDANGEIKTLADAIAKAKEDGTDIVTYTIYGAATLETGYSHGIVDFGGREGYITIKGGSGNTRSTDSFTITGGGIPDIKGVTFKDLTFYDEGEYLTTANEFMYQNFIDCTFENVTFEDGIRLSGNSVVRNCTFNANTNDEYAIWLDKGTFEMTGSTVTAGNEAYGLLKSDEVNKITISDNTFQYLAKVNKEALNVKGAIIVAEDNTFIDCAKGIVPADKVNYTADGTTQITDAIIADDNIIIIYVAQIGDVKYQSLAEAATAAQNGETIQLLWAEGHAPISMAATVVNNKTVTITGTANVDWDKGWLYVGRNGEGNGKLIFNEANLTSKSVGTGTNGTGLNVSCKKVGESTTNDGEVEIINSNIQLDYLIGKGNIKLDNSTLEVYEGFAVGARPASETGGVQRTVTMDITNGSNVIVDNHNGQGLGHESNGIMNIDATSTFETQRSFLVTANGTMNNAGTVNITGTLTNEGTINFTDDAATLATTTGGLTINYDLNPDKKVVYVDGVYKVVDKVYVAQIGENKYESLQEAVEAVAEDETIVLLGDITFTTGANGSTNGISYTRGVNFTLDLSGKTITSDLGGNALRFKIGDGNDDVTNTEVTINVKNGKVVSGSNNWCAISAAVAENSNNKLTMNLTNLVVEANKAGDFAIKSWAGAVVNTNNVDVISSYAGGFYACGGEIVLDENSSVNQEGLHTQPYMSYAFGVSNNGKMTINGGTYSAVPAAVTDAYDQGTSHGSAVGGVMSSGGTLIINGGTFSNDNFGDNSLATAARYLIYADAKGDLQINGGTFNALKGIIDNTTNTGADVATVTLKGGTYSANPKPIYNGDAAIPAGYALKELANGYYTVIQIAGTQTREFATPGWYWFSTYIQFENEEVALDKLQTALDGNASMIKGQHGFTNYSTYNGTGYWSSVASALTTLSTAEMYMIRTTAQSEVELTGSFVDYQNRDITLREGWNWIGYPVSQEMSLSDAIPAGALKDGDQIKSQFDGSATYYNRTLSNGTPLVGWSGQLTQLKPGYGYMFNSASERTFNYTTDGNGAKSTLNTIDYNGENHWFADATQYPNNMTVTAMLSIDGEIVKDNYEVAAFANGECRGSARPIYIEALDAYMLFMTIQGEDVENLTFKYYDVNYGTEYELNNTMVYSNDAIVGTIEEPYMFNLGILNIDETSVDQISIYPNPTTTGKEINLQAMCDKVEVFNALGVKVAEYTNVDSIDALETAGIYVIRVTIDGNARNCRLVVR